MLVLLARNSDGRTVGQIPEARLNKRGRSEAGHSAADFAWRILLMLNPQGGCGRRLAVEMCWLLHIRMAGRTAEILEAETPFNAL
jgi:hypothetical protein